VIKPLDLVKAGSLTFHKPDFKRFPCLELAQEAAKAGAGLPAVLNAADEVAVGAFLAGRIAFTGIAAVIETTMRAYRGSSRLPGFAEVLEIDAWARGRAEEACRR
jgi:1-deoxy-D-xylulose-5-phosphate reductoisomerase